MGQTCKGFLIDRCLKDRQMLEQFTIIKQKKALGGFVKIVEIEVGEEKLGEVISFFQKHMVERIGFIKQQFFVHFYCGKDGIVVFKDRTFIITSDPATWEEAIKYGERLGIKKKQLVFEEEI